jgi:prepilin-type processing-associated H-X9-DG protein
VYKIIGGDKKEYGPVTAAQLRQWIQDRRVNAQTQVQVAGADAWQTAGALPEFAEDFAAASAAPRSPAEAPALEARRSRMAVASLVLGILGVFTLGVTALAGLVLGIVALTRISGSRGRLSGSGLATAGVAVSGVALLLVPIIAIMAGMLLPALSQAKGKAQQVHCLGNVRQLNMAIRLYAADNDEKLPPVATWSDVIQSAIGTPKLFQCPACPEQTCAYAFNAKVAGLDQTKVHPETVIVFESDAGWNAAGGAELLPSRPRHTGGFIVGFADSHAELVSQARLAGLRWDP